MEKETINEEDDFNIDDLLAEEEDSPVESYDNIDENIVDKPRARGRPRSAPEKKSMKKPAQKVPVEIAEANKDLSDMEWQFFSQPEYIGFQNVKTGEVIDDREAIRRTLCYAQEAARNSR